MTNFISQEMVLPPNAIRDAIVRITDPRFPIPLSAPVRLAFTFLLRRVEVSNGLAEFWVKRMNFAAVVGKCDKTISNWLNELQTAGLIIKEQRKTNWGAYKCLTVQLTDLAVHLLELNSPSDKKISQERNISSRVLLPQLETKTLPAGGSAKAVELQNIRPQQGTLPADLQPIVSEKLQTTGVYKLMGIASASGKRLSDVVAACGPHIAKAKNPYAYILALIRRDKDYATIAASKGQEQAQEKAESDDTELINRAWAYLQGTTVSWRGRDVDVKAPRQPCEIYMVGVDGKRTYCGSLVGAQLLRFIRDQAISPEDET